MADLVLGAGVVGCDLVVVSRAFRESKRAGSCTMFSDTSMPTHCVV